MIRKMKLSDIEKIDEAFIAQNWGKRTEVLTNYFKEQELSQRFVFIAEFNGEVAGYVTLQPKALHGPFKGQFPEVADFNVFEKFQRHGLGNALLEAVEEKASEFSQFITLGVGLHPGYGAAQRLYVKRGYVPDGSGIWYHNEILPMDAKLKTY